MTASSTKFYYCVSSLNQETANQVLDLIKSPPATEPYEALLKLFALDDFQRYEAISNLPLFRDMKPSKLMSNMLALLPVGLNTYHVSFYEEPFSRDCPPMFTPTCSGMISPILFLSPLKQTKYIRQCSKLLSHLIMLQILLLPRILLLRCWRCWRCWQCWPCRRCRILHLLLLQFFHQVIKILQFQVLISRSFYLFSSLVHQSQL